MRLYQNSKGQWFGTQADARRNSPRDWREVEVPTSKQELLNWLNLHNFGSKSAGLAPDGNKTPPSGNDGEDLNTISTSWVAWALDTLNRGDINESKTMLTKGLQAQYDRRK